MINALATAIGNGTRTEGGDAPGNSNGMEWTVTFEGLEDDMCRQFVG